MYYLSITTTLKSNFIGVLKYTLLYRKLVHYVIKFYTSILSIFQYDEYLIKY